MVYVMWKLHRWDFIAGDGGEMMSCEAELHKALYLSSLMCAS